MLEAKVIGQKIKEIRKRNGLTQQEFADAIGISANAVSKIEPGMRVPSVDLLTVIATTFKVSINWILLDVGSYELIDEAN